MVAWATSLQPRSVAVVGPTRRRGTVGRAILHNIVTGGFTGPVYAVNPHARTIEGVPCVASVSDLPGQVDLAVIAVSPSALPEVAPQCGRNGVRALVVITSALGAAGADLQAICRQYGMRLVGPNCFGIIMPWIGLDATFAADHPLPGVAGVVVQSGGVGIALLEQMSRLGIGVSSFASVGDKYDVSPNNLLTDSSKVTRTPGSPCSRAPATRKCNPSSVLPDPVPPVTSVDLPWGRPPRVISSSPRIPVGALGNGGPTAVSASAEIGSAIIGRLYPFQRRFQSPFPNAAG